jgi:pectate lyase
VVPAFPGAEGAGALSKGGRGGVVIEVTNLNDSGAGSLRACVRDSRPRTCVFRVGGTIELLSNLDVDSPYLTVAGQTAPGGGIQLSGRNMTQAMVRVRAHDVVWRYTRIRKGYNASTPDQGGGVFAVLPGAYNVIADHNSLFWAQDENLTIWSTASTAQHDITLSWNIVAEPLASHPTSYITGAATRAVADAMTDIDAHHSLFANSSHRNPLIKTRSARIVSNVFYNYAFYGTQFGGGVNGDVISNLYRAGPLNQRSVHEIQAFPGGNGTAANGAPSLYVAGNVGPSNPTGTGDDWSTMVRQVASENGSETGALSTAYRRSTPLAPKGVAITAHPASGLTTTVLPLVGASRRLDCDGSWVSARDAADARVVNDVAAGTGRIPTTEAEVGGFPVIAAGTPCADSDHDGMPDAWEQARGLNPQSASDGSAVGADGYTNLERFLAGS